MLVSSQSEWMKAQKHGNVMGPSGHFDVIQTANEGSIFFSLGTDNVLYATKEVQSSSTGWNRIDLTTGLSAQLNGALVAAKAFAVSQNPLSAKWDITVVVTAGDSDHLFVSQGNDLLGVDAQALAISWKLVPFDADGKPEGSVKVKIADVFVMNVPGVGSTCVVDIWRKPGVHDSLDRYFITPSKTIRWNRHLLAIDLDAGTVSSVLGFRTKDRVAGIYTFGSVEGKTQLIYVPLYNAFRPNVPANPSRLASPLGTTAIASSFDSAGRSCLFVSHPGGLSVFPTANAQIDGAKPSLCISAPVVANASQLQAFTVGKQTSVFGRNAQGGLFYATCAAGSEAISASWTYPVVLVPHVENFAFYAGLSTSSHTLFAHTAGDQMIELDQDPVTSIWRQRNILLPSAKVDDMVEFDSYTTRIEVTDDKKTLQSNVSIKVKSISPVPVYINDDYYLLSPRYDISVTTDGNGSVTIVQPTTALAAVCYQVSVGGGSSTLVDPSLKAMQKLKAIQSGDDLANVKITDSSGTTKPLVSSSVNSDDRDAAAGALKQFCDVGKGLNADGSPTTASPMLKSAQSVSPTSGTQVLALSISPDAPMSISTKSTTGSSGNSIDGKFAVQAMSVGSAIESIGVKTGDFFRMLGNTLKDGLQSLEVRIIDGVNQIFATIKGVVYNALLDSWTAIAHAAEWVFTQIKVFLDDLIMWLGFLFGWKDILRTHAVIKNVAKQYIRKGLDGLGQAQETISMVFEDLEGHLNQWADITDPGIKTGSYVANTNREEGSSSPQTHWGSNHLKANSKSAEMNPKDHGSVADDLDAALRDLEALVDNQVDAVRDMISQIRTQVIDEFYSLSPMQIVKRIIGIISDLMLKSTKNVLVGTIDLVRVLAKTVLDVLDTPINIPVLSTIYKWLTGDDLSVLDVAALVAAIPVTVMYKLAMGSAPFPDNDMTSALRSASSHKEIESLVLPPRAAASKATGTAHVSTMRLTIAVPEEEKLTAQDADTTTTTTTTTPDPRSPTLADASKSTTIPNPSDWVPESGAGAEVYRIFCIIGRFLSVVTTFTNQLLFDVNWGLDRFDLAGSVSPDAPAKWLERANIVLNILPAIITAFGRPDTPPGAWYAVMNDALLGLDLARTLVGTVKAVKMHATWRKVNPFAAAFIQLALIPPTIGNIAELEADRKKIRQYDYVWLAGLLCQRLAGVLNWVSIPIEEVETALVVLGAANVTSGMQGVFMLTSTALYIEDK